MADGAGLQAGLVVASHGRHVLVETESGERRLCHARGKKATAVVGDQLSIAVPGCSATERGGTGRPEAAAA